jgi:rhodanese-related sulfurtransferase
MISFAITPQLLAALHQKGERVDLIDVRTPAEYAELHVEFARNLPLDRLNPEAIAAQRSHASGPLYVICKTGSRANQACEKLATAGLNVMNVEGGTLAWDAAGLPVVRGRPAISLERQVRIAIGLVVLSSAVLAILVHPYWMGLAAFMGAGLIFSGITDFCGLALLLGRMPWNQARAQSRETQGEAITDGSAGRMPAPRDVWRPAWVAAVHSCDVSEWRVPRGAIRPRRQRRPPIRR